MHKPDAHLARPALSAVPSVQARLREIVKAMAQQAAQEDASQ
jgi:hypothetical protein